MQNPARFEINIDQSVLDQVWQEVKGYEFQEAPSDEADGDWSRGCSTHWLMGLQDYWLNHYDWRAQEALLNAWPNYKETIDDQEIHFIHVVGEAQGRRPLLITHGWPGSVFEFYKVIEPLAFPSRFGGSADDAFDLIIPSLPGFGFSGRPKKPIGQRATAALWRKLMVDVLGYTHFLAQGGDWGSFVTSWLGFDHSDVVKAIHLNFLGVRPADQTPMTEEEANWLKTSAFMMQLGGAYFQVQATQPQTLALAIGKSPMGQAAWIMEKFQSWTDLSRGSLDEVYGKDALLTNLMFYVLTDRFQTSVWYYRALLEEGSLSLPAGQRVEVPTSFSKFPGEKIYAPPPRSWAERVYNIQSWNEVPYGGHFAAMEAPDLFVEELYAFGRRFGGSAR